MVDKNKQKCHPLNLTQVDRIQTVASDLLRREDGPSYSAMIRNKLPWQQPHHNLPDHPVTGGTPLRSMTSLCAGLLRYNCFSYDSCVRVTIQKVNKKTTRFDKYGVNNTNYKFVNLLATQMN